MGNFQEPNAEDKQDEDHAKIRNTDKKQNELQHKVMLHTATLQLHMPKGNNNKSLK